MKTTAFLRSIELAKLVAKIGLKEVRSGSLQSRIEQATVLAESLSQLKGAAMKAGQLLSLDLIDYFPKEAAEILTRLQSSAVELDFSVIEQILRRELGPEGFSEIIDIQRSPIGSASIGQVHRAKYRDRQIVLKVQYPEVAESIGSDLKILKTLARALCTLSGREMELEPLFQEFRTMLEQEVNYEHEAQSQMRYRSLAPNLAGNPELKYLVPEVHREISTSKVLAMDWQSGVPLRRWIQEVSSQEKRTRLGRGILDLYMSEFFHWGFVQTDPNQANFLVQDAKDDLTLVLLDFGATRDYSREFRSKYVQLLNSTLDGNRKLLRNNLVEFGLIDSRESPEAFEAMFDVLLVAVSPFKLKRVSSGDSMLFDFSDVTFIRDAQNTTRVLAAQLKYSPPPRDLVFLHRKLGGVYATLKALGVSLDVSPYWRDIQDLARN